MSFLTTLREHNVTWTTAPSALFIFFGLALWSTPLALYVAAWRTTSGVDALWIANVAVHCGVGALVIVEALVTQGRFWPLQTVIIGGATYVTFAVAGLLGYHATRDDGVALVAAALASACVSNAVLVSMLFELFHRGMATPPPPAPMRPRRSAGIAPPIRPRRSAGVQLQRSI